MFITHFSIASASRPASLYSKLISPCGTNLSSNPKDLLYRSIFLDCAQLVKIVEAFDETDTY